MIVSFGEGQKRKPNPWMLMETRRRWGVIGCFGLNAGIVLETKPYPGRSTVYGLCYVFYVLCSVLGRYVVVV
ncbi:hypothetical protein F4809DRAFT_413276 [Biscogniauxia mediterranea]|nr:hypothetical protein F4809DRAFT_413276 [Biscogniauxia mediterranea]